MRKEKLNAAFIHIILILMAFVMIVPFLWMLLTAFKTISEATSVNPFVILPSSWKFDSLKMSGKVIIFLYSTKTRC